MSKPKPNKPPKLPAPFRPEFDAAEFEKRIAKRIHVKGELEFARSLYRPDGGAAERLVFQGGLDKAGNKRLKALAKAVKRNRGFVSWGKLAIVGALALAFVAFNLFFKNALVSQALENGLAGVFGAKAEVSGLDFDPLGGKITLAGLAVADRDQPMRNLFQLGQTGMVVDMWQALNGRVLIDLLQCSDIRFGTPRAVSGALPGRPAAPTPAPAAQGGADPLAGFVDLDKLDAKSLVAGQLDKLESVKLAASVGGEFGALTDQAKAASAELDAKVKQLAGDAAKRIAGNLAQARSKEELNAALAKSTDFKAEIAALQKEADSQGAKLKDLQKRYEGKLKGIEAAAKRDQADLGKLVAQPQGAGGALAGQALEQVMGARARELLAAAAKIPRVLEALGQGNEQPVPAERRRGRVVDFPVPQHPKFQISRIEGSIWWSRDLRLALKVSNVSSDQNITGAPTIFSVSFGSDALYFGLDGRVDLRSGADYRLAMDGGMRGLQVDLGDELAFAGLRRFQARADIEGSYRLDPRGDAAVEAAVGLAAIKSQADPASLVGRVCQAALAEIGGRATGRLQIGLKADGSYSFDLQSGLDSALASGLRTAVEGELRAMSKQIGDELAARIDGALGAERGKQLRQLVADNAADVKTLKDLQKKADQSLADLQKAAKLLGAGADLGKGLNGLKLPGF